MVVSGGVSSLYVLKTISTKVGKQLLPKNSLFSVNRIFFLLLFFFCRIKHQKIFSAETNEDILILGSFCQTSILLSRIFELTSSFFLIFHMNTDFSKKQLSAF